MLKVHFLGDKAEDSVFCATTVRCGVSVDILHGKIEYISHHAMGLLVVRLADLPPDSVPAALAASYGGTLAERIDAAVQFIRDNATHVEVLHAH